MKGATQSVAGVVGGAQTPQKKEGKKEKIFKRAYKNFSQNEKSKIQMLHMLNLFIKK